MTTRGVAACLRRVLDHLGLRERDVNMMLTGGPDGDLGANKGGVTSSSVAEVLTAFLLGEDYEEALVTDSAAGCELVRAVSDLIEANADAETRMLLDLHGHTARRCTYSFGRPASGCWRCRAGSTSSWRPS
jgi:hypothetical protein